MSDDLKFSIQRTRALVLAGCFAAVSVLLFFAGTVTGLLYSGTHAKTTLIVSAPTAPARPHGAPDKTPEAPTDAAATSSTASTPDEPTPSSTAPAATAAAAAPPSISPAPSSAAAATPKTPPPPAATTTDAAKPASEQASDTASETAPSLTIPLAVQVGAFSVKANAETLVQSLGDMGYKPLVSRSTDAHGHQWYVVRVGPYTQWNAASRVAARISMTEDVNPVIGPMRQ
jgi:cell division protein FtsN